MQESQNIEWKEIWKDEYLKWICGFANASGGKIIIGKNDKGEIVGLKNSKKLLEDIPNKVKDILGILVEVRLQKYNNQEFIEIIVESYPFPVNYKGRYYFRSGSTLQELKGQALNDFLLKKSRKTWEEALELQASFDEIFIDAIE
ncbi:MAG TPA: ATP-binding protein [Bacteroidetes bacterium]|nr:ATP-binding protein [Bacteroidota bacterium]